MLKGPSMAEQPFLFLSCSNMGTEKQQAQVDKKTDVMVDVEVDMQVDVGVEVPAVLAHGVQVGQGILLGLMGLLQPQLCLLPLPQCLLLHLHHHYHQSGTVSIAKRNQHHPGSVSKARTSVTAIGFRALKNALLWANPQHGNPATSVLFKLGAGNPACFGRGPWGEGREPTKS